MSPPAPSSRFATLDGLRGAAALSVLAFHSINTIVVSGTDTVANALLYGWLGVFVFFPVSGYCILAATRTRSNATVTSFLERRCRRILPTYWASIVFAVLVLVVTSPFSTADLSQLSSPGWKWLSILTLTQTLAGLPNAINPVYWSLCYEAQFYLVIACSLVLPERFRAAALLALTVAASGWRLTLGPGVSTGWFMDYWLEFAVGMAAFGWAQPAFGRIWASTVLAIGVAMCATHGELSTIMSTSVALTILAARRFDRAIAGTAVMRVLAAVGVMSYSLYLTHVPIAGRVVNGLRRIVDDPSSHWVGFLVAASIPSLGMAYLFYRVVEARTLAGARSGGPAVDALAPQPAATA